MRQTVAVTGASLRTSRELIAPVGGADRAGEALTVAYFRQHWYQVGGALAVLMLPGLLLWHEHLSGFRFLLCVSLLTLFVHQFEEYQFPGPSRA